MCGERLEDILGSCWRCGSEKSDAALAGRSEFADGNEPTDAVSGPGYPSAPGDLGAATRPARTGPEGPARTPASPEFTDTEILLMLVVNPIIAGSIVYLMSAHLHLAGDLLALSLVFPSIAMGYGVAWCARFLRTRHRSRLVT